MLDVKQLELQYVTNDAGEKTAVILPIGQFQELIDDIEDLATVAERRRDELTFPHKQLSLAVAT
jgi:hypothetical protein